MEIEQDSIASASISDGVSVLSGKKGVLVVLSGWLKIWYITDPPSQRHEREIHNDLYSTSKCNCQGGMCGEEYFVRGSKAKCLSRLMIDPFHYFVDLFPGNVQ